jgi:hypothetical protein
MNGEHKILGLFAAAFAICAAALFLVSTADRGRSTAAQDVSNLSGSTVVEIRDLSNSRVLSGHFVSRASTVHETLRVALLVAGAGSAVGSAEIELNRHPNGVLLQELEIDVEGLSPNAPYDIVVDGHAIGVLSTDGRGAAEFERLGAVADAPVRSGD